MMREILRQFQKVLPTGVLTLSALLTSAELRADDTAVWERLRSGGHVVLIRHALAPGVGDPPQFKLGECATQRNLSDEGRQQARAIGEAFRRAGIRVDGVLSSRWCRSFDTAVLMDLGPIEAFPALDSFFRNRERGEPSTASLRAYLDTIGKRTVLMVTHQVNITALTGIYPDSSEAVVVAPGDGTEIRIVGRLRF